MGKRKKEESAWKSIAMYEVKQMTMDETVARINELARKAKQTELSAEEIKERDALRRVYIDSWKASLVSQLENTYIVDENGNKRKVQKKK